MNPKRLHQGLTQLGLSVQADAEERLLFFAEELLRWNQRVNLTAITDPDEVIEKHLIDSLTPLPMLGSSGNLLDIGSGGGFPALPLKIARPELEILSVDAVEKKILFQRHVARSLSLSGFTARHGRIEELAGESQLNGPFDVVVSRALSDLPTYLAWAKPFVAKDGLLIAMKGREGEEELKACRERIGRLELNLCEVRHVVLPFSGSRRCLLSFSIRA